MTALRGRTPSLHRPAGDLGPPARIVHVGMGAFARAHQAYYTHRANQRRTTSPWGIVGFTGRTSHAATVLAGQDGLYHLITRAADGDRFERVDSVRAAYSGASLARLAASIGDRHTALITITVTEGGYHLDGPLRLALDSPTVSADRDTLAELIRLGASAFWPALASASLTSMPARIVLGLEQRRRDDGGPVAVVPCDNISANGAATRSVVSQLASEVSSQLPAWIDARVTFVDTCVDRITPAVTAADLRAVTERTGLEDAAAVVAEPFYEWVLQDRFPAGRPAWESVGAQFVDDVGQFEHRKLWLLNGAHTLLAYAGLLAGHRTVAQAIGDDRIRGWVESLWQEASAELPSELELERYRRTLVERFANPRIEHRLDQIAADGIAKVRVRVVPVLERIRKRGGRGEGAARVIAAWIAYLLATERTAVTDAAAAEIESVRSRTVGHDPQPLLELLNPELGSDAQLVDDIRSLTGEVLTCGDRR